MSPESPIHSAGITYLHARDLKKSRRKSQYGKKRRPSGCAAVLVALVCLAALCCCHAVTAAPDSVNGDGRSLKPKDGTIPTPRALIGADTVLPDLQGFSLGSIGDNIGSILNEVPPAVGAENEGEELPQEPVETKDSKSDGVQGTQNRRRPSDRAGDDGDKPIPTQRRQQGGREGNNTPSATSPLPTNSQNNNKVDPGATRTKVSEGNTVDGDRRRPINQDVPTQPDRDQNPNQTQVPQNERFRTGITPPPQQQGSGSSRQQQGPDTNIPQKSQKLPLDTNLQNPQQQNTPDDTSPVPPQNLPVIQDDNNNTPSGSTGTQRPPEKKKKFEISKGPAIAAAVCSIGLIATGIGFYSLKRRGGMVRPSAEFKRRLKGGNDGHPWGSDHLYTSGPPLGDTLPPPDGYGVKKAGISTQPAEYATFDSVNTFTNEYPGDSVPYYPSFGKPYPQNPPQHYYPQSEFASQHGGSQWGSEINPSDHAAISSSQRISPQQYPSLNAPGQQQDFPNRIRYSPDDR